MGKPSPLKAGRPISTEHLMASGAETTPLTAAKAKGFQFAYVNTVFGRKITMDRIDAAVDEVSRIPHTTKYGPWKREELKSVMMGTFYNWKGILS